MSRATAFRGSRVCRWLGAPWCAGAAIAAGLFLAAPPAHATFHISRINEVMSGAAGNPNIQYVEINMLAPFQSFVAHTRLTAFNCNGSAHAVLFTVPTDLANNGANVKWVMASPDDATFFAATGLHADFYFAPGIDPSCGMVCWGAPGITAPTDPNTWNAGDPNNYVDCLGYGGYTGPTKTSTHDSTPMSGTPSTLPAGNGSDSLSRLSDTQNNLADFGLACPSPTNNAGQSGSFGVCTGLVPPNKTVATCEDKVTKSLAKLAGCTTKCQVKQADNALAVKPFDESACETGTGTPVSCRAAYDNTSATLDGQNICPACLDSTARGEAADVLSSFLEQNNGQIYCAGSTAFGDDDPGFIPPDANTAKCEDAVAKNLATLATCITNCEIKQADKALKGMPIDLTACENDVTKPTSCRAIYDKHSATLLAKTPPICPPCLDATAQGHVADLLTTFLDDNNGALRCTGTMPLAPHMVFVGPNNTLTFSPKNLTIAVGDTVEWVWLSGGHNVVSGTDTAAGCAADGKFCSPADSNCGAAPIAFPGAIYTHTFTAAGTFPYFCAVHCGLGMDGVITAQ